MMRKFTAERLLCLTLTLWGLGALFQEYSLFGWGLGVLLLAAMVWADSPKTRATLFVQVAPIAVILTILPRLRSPVFFGAAAVLFVWGGLILLADAVRRWLYAPVVWGGDRR